MSYVVVNSQLVTVGESSSLLPGDVPDAPDSAFDIALATKRPVRGDARRGPRAGCVLPHASRRHAQDRAGLGGDAMTAISDFAAAAMDRLAPGRDHHELRDAIVAQVEAELPIFKDDADKMRTTAYVIAVAFRESSLRLDAVGDNGHSVCAFQVWGGSRALLTDAGRCVSVAFAMLRTSARYCPAFPLAWFALGGDAAKACASPHAQRISRDRLALAAWLLRTVKP